MKSGATTGNKTIPGAGTDTDGVPWPPQRIHKSHQEVISCLKTITQTDRIAKRPLRATTQNRETVAARAKAVVPVKGRDRGAVLAAARAMAVAVKKMVAGAVEWAVEKAMEAVVPDDRENSETISHNNIRQGGILCLDLIKEDQ
ncbi:hypothetical protein JCM12294_27130 [Desulfocicer niacini]